MSATLVEHIDHHHTHVDLVVDNQHNGARRRAASGAQTLAPPFGTPCFPEPAKVDRPLMLTHEKNGSAPSI
jgi:hypothetical protein